MSADEAETITWRFWAAMREDMIRYLRTRGFKTDMAAKKCVDNFIKTMTFVARETREPMLGARVTSS